MVRGHKPIGESIQCGLGGFCCCGEDVGDIALPPLSFEPLLAQIVHGRRKAERIWMSGQFRNGLDRIKRRSQQAKRAARPKGASFDCFVKSNQAFREPVDDACDAIDVRFIIMDRERAAA
jgi:hypothetical protein